MVSRRGGISSFKKRVIEVIKKIPEGKVTSYGTIAALAGIPRGARLVGGILHYYMDEHEIAWYRVVNRDGYISTRCLEHPKALQKKLLESEGVVVSSDFMIDLKIYGWYGG